MKLKDMFPPMVIFNVLCLILIILLFIFMPSEIDTKYTNSIEYQNDIQKLKEMSGINDSGENILKTLMASRKVKYDANCVTAYSYYYKRWRTTCNYTESIYTEPEKFAKIVYDKIHNVSRILSWAGIIYIFISGIFANNHALDFRGNWDSHYKPYTALFWPIFVFI